MNFFLNLSLSVSILLCFFKKKLFKGNKLVEHFFVLFSPTESPVSNVFVC